MTFYWFDLLQFSFLALTVLFIYRYATKKSNNKTLPIAMVAITLLMIFFSPVNMTQKNQSHIHFTNSEYSKGNNFKSNEETFEERNKRLKKELEESSKQKFTQTTKDN